ncbi:MAG: exodeoxyribonuclease III, partial [Flavobacteriales bacterium]|nr:exodeoxyribonuclease III [Flavobacteriales bacterium]
KGWRIDYIMVSLGMAKKLNSASILSNIFHSDHCPISISF